MKKFLVCLTLVLVIFGTSAVKAAEPPKQSTATPSMYMCVNVLTKQTQIFVVVNPISGGMLIFDNHGQYVAMIMLVKGENDSGDILYMGEDDIVRTVIKPDNKTEHGYYMQVTLKPEAYKNRPPTNLFCD